MDPIRLTLPQPALLNHYWRHAILKRGRLASVSVYISAEGKAFRARAIAAVRAQHPRHATITGPVAVRCAFFIERRGTDVDAASKAALDALTHACLWVDDNQVCELSVVRRYDRANPRLELEITPVADNELVDAWNADAGKAARKRGAA